MKKQINSTIFHSERRFAYHHRIIISVAVLLFVSIGAIILPKLVKAASVDLTISSTVPASSTLQPFNYEVTVTDSSSNAASNANLDVQLPAGLYNVAVTNVSSIGPASCPSAASFTVPTGYSDGNGHISGTIPLLNANTSCVITITATPWKAQSYNFTATIAAGVSDSDTAPDSNTTVNSMVVSNSTTVLNTTKQIVTAPNASGYYNFNVPIEYAISFTNNSSLAIPLVNPDDGSSTLYDNTGPVGNMVAGNTTISAQVLSCISAGGAPCPTITGNSGPYVSGSIEPLTFSSTATDSMPAGSTITVHYTITYTPNQCGNLGVLNNVRFHLSGDSTQDPSSNIQSSVTTQFESPKVCQLDVVNPTMTKHLVNITDSSSNIKPVVTTDGDSANFIIHIVNDDPSGNATSYRFVDNTQIVGGPNSHYGSPSTYTEHIVIKSCQLSVPNPDGSCPAGWTSYPFDTGVNSIDTNYITLGANQSVDIEVSVVYTGLDSLNCLNSQGLRQNRASINIPTGNMPQAPYDGYGGNTAVVVVSENYQVSPNKPSCVDISTNKSINNNSPSPGQTVHFILDYTNNSGAATFVGAGNGPVATNVAILDQLGSDFTATAISCSVLSGTATAPSVSLSDISGSQNIFNTTIPSMDDTATVECVISGSRSVIGSYTNITSAVVSGDEYDIDTSNNSASVAYGVVLSQVTLQKTVTGGTPIAGSVFPVTVLCTSPLGDTSSTVDLVPGVPQTINVPPTTSTNTPTCVVSEGAQPTAPSGYTWGAVTISQSIFTPPQSGGSMNVDVTNNLVRLLSGLTITEHITGSGLATTQVNGDFDFTVDCGVDGIFTGTATMNSGSDTVLTIASIPVNAICIIQQTGVPTSPANYAWSSAAYDTNPVSIDVNGSAIITTTPLVQLTGALMITKRISGPGANQVTGDFDVSIDCGADGSYVASLSVVDGLDSVATVTNIPAGAECKIRELSSRPSVIGYSWGTPSLTNTDVTILANSTNPVVLINPLTANPILSHPENTPVTVPNTSLMQSASIKGLIPAGIVILITIVIVLSFHSLQTRKK